MKELKELREQNDLRELELVELQQKAEQLRQQKVTLMGETALAAAAQPAKQPVSSPPVPAAAQPGKPPASPPPQAMLPPANGAEAQEHIKVEPGGAVVANPRGERFSIQYLYKDDRCPRCKVSAIHSIHCQPPINTTHSALTTRDARLGGVNRHAPG